MWNQTNEITSIQLP